MPGLKAIARFCGMVQGVVVQITTDAPVSCASRPASAAATASRDSGVPSSEGIRFSRS